MNKDKLEKLFHNYLYLRSVMKNNGHEEIVYTFRDYMVDQVNSLGKELDLDE